MGEPSIVVREHDPAWPRLFEVLRGRLLDVLGGLAVAVEHVGSTAVPGLTAKPVVDINAVVPSAEDVPLAVERLERAGYRHEGDLGIPGREAFRPPADAPWHHLYILTAEGEELRRHLAFRDYLRAHPEGASTYAGDRANNRATPERSHGWQKTGY
ncbi:MAG: GrpB family protein [Rubrobacter sp.]